jgi:hypothetical protein
MRGSIVRRGRNSWRIKFDVPDAGGARQTRYVTVRGNKAAAQKELTKLLSSVDTGSYVDPANTTIGEFLERWLRDWCPANVSPKTLERYSGIVHNNVVPHLGDIKIQKLRAAAVAEMYATLLREGRHRKTDDTPVAGLSPRTVGHVHRVPHRALDIAVKWGVIPHNVADKVDAPRVEDSEVEIIKADALPGLLDALRGRMLYTVAVVGLGTGTSGAVKCWRYVGRTST